MNIRYLDFILGLLTYFPASTVADPDAPPYSTSQSALSVPTPAEHPTELSNIFDGPQVVDTGLTASCPTGQWERSWTYTHWLVPRA